MQERENADPVNIVTLHDRTLTQVRHCKQLKALADAVPDQGPACTHGFCLPSSCQVMDERRLSLLLDSKGVVKEASGSPKTLFGFEAQALVSGAGRLEEHIPHFYAWGACLNPTCRWAATWRM